MDGPPPAGGAGGGLRRLAAGIRRQQLALGLLHDGAVRLQHLGPGRRLGWADHSFVAR